MEARKEWGSFRRGEMSLARKHRPSDSGVVSRRGRGGSEGQSPQAPRPHHYTRGTTAPASGSQRPAGPSSRPAPCDLPAPAHAHLNSTPGVGKSGKLRMRRATSCSWGSAIATSARTCPRLGPLGSPRTG